MAAGDYSKMTVQDLLQESHERQAEFLCELVKNNIHRDNVKLMDEASRLKREHYDEWKKVYDAHWQYQKSSEFMAAAKEINKRSGTVQRLENAIEKLESRAKTNPSMGDVLATKKKELAAAKEALQEDLSPFAKERRLQAELMKVEEKIGLTAVERKLKEMTQKSGRSAKGAGAKFEQRALNFMLVRVPETEDKLWLSDVDFGAAELDAVYALVDPDTHRVLEVLKIAEFKLNPHEIGASFVRFAKTTFRFLNGERIPDFKNFKGVLDRDFAHKDRRHGKLTFDKNAFRGKKVEDVYYVSTKRRNGFADIGSVDAMQMVTRFFYDSHNDYTNPASLTKEAVSKILAPFVGVPAEPMSLSQVKAEYAKNNKSNRLIFLKEE